MFFSFMILSAISYLSIGAPLNNNCDDAQKSCLNVKMMAIGAGWKYIVCIYGDRRCYEEEDILYSCSTDDDDDDDDETDNIEQGIEGQYIKKCKLASCESTVRFWIKGCSDSADMNGITIGDYDNIACEYSNGYCGGRCIWTIPTPQCPDSPTNPCDDPCQNGGTCLQDGDGYNCICNAGYIGIDCECADPCNPNPCQNGGGCSGVSDNGECPTFECSGISDNGDPSAFGSNEETPQEIEYEDGDGNNSQDIYGYYIVGGIFVIILIITACIIYHKRKWNILSREINDTLVLYGSNTQNTL